MTGGYFFGTIIPYKNLSFSLVGNATLNKDLLPVMNAVMVVLAGSGINQVLRVNSDANGTLWFLR